ncbi:Hypothetical protein SMAX5B_010265 [Scophthalmus maximus]|uniref:Uncharacterized protein n=1 Tax=Scophthalmus maximus TaxID=52904 RepID=A0A2U9CC62_SCOMX|nr:Hypothetical protein SMAX5B_010265 [Scophthalmus maximus]
MESARRVSVDQWRRSGVGEGAGLRCSGAPAVSGQKKKKDPSEGEEDGERRPELEESRPVLQTVSSHRQQGRPEHEQRQLL